MIIIRTILNTLPEKKREVLQTLLAMVEAPANDNGLLSYGIYTDIGNNNIFNLISEWETRGHMNDHLNSDTFSVLLGTQSLLLKPIEIQILNVSSIEGIEAVYAARKAKG
ncbi:putative quinol monooxygenase [Desulfosediminicola ganghwensis]|uniref:putative quinol monooxygenase n=1 Tax=Desulfosediminicola ganghwensis TaxID=2569540 RepID=UPI001E2C1043|nr:antibiotic biosynthesis monooxygenase family protein [Desulfosediminicola ganghwensis]